MGLFPVFRFAIPTTTTTTTTHLTHHTHSFFFSSPMPLAGCCFCFVFFWFFVFCFGLCFFFEILFYKGEQKKKQKKHKKIHLHSWALEWITWKREWPSPSAFLPCEKTQSNCMFCACFLSFFLCFCKSVQLGHKKRMSQRLPSQGSDSVSFGLLSPLPPCFTLKVSFSH